MSSFPCLVRFVPGSGLAGYRLGERLVDWYLEFVAGRCRPDTLRAVAFDLKTFFTVTGKDPVQVTAADVFEFLAHHGQSYSPPRATGPATGLLAARPPRGQASRTPTVPSATYVLPWSSISLVMLSTPATPATASSAAAR